MDRLLQRVENVRKRRESPPTYQGVVFPAIPEEYEDFEAYPKAVSAKKGKGRKRRVPAKGGKGGKKQKA